MNRRLDHGLEWAAAEARRAIHANDIERLKQLLADYPALLSWHGNEWDSRGLLGIATGSYGDSFDPGREQTFTRAACAEILIDSGAIVTPSVCEGLFESRARVRSFVEQGSLDPTHARAVGPWKAFVMGQVERAIHDRDLTAFVHGLQRERWLLGEACVWFEAELIGNATLNDREEFIVALFDLDPALLRRQPPPPSQAIEFAFTYAHTHLIPLLTRIWPVPDDLRHAAGMGNLARVRHWFDAASAPALGDLDNHYPYNDPRARGHLRWDPPTAQQVLDTALAFSIVNRHYEVADFLLERGADINTNWSSHEAASLLHELCSRGTTSRCAS